FRDGDEVALYSRNERPLTRYFPELVPALQRIAPTRVVLDGEVVIFTGQGTDFDLMLQRIHPADSRIKMLAAETPASYIVFDALADGGLRGGRIPLGQGRQAGRLAPARRLPGQDARVRWTHLELRRRPAP